jgi:type I restriction enzyme S subunit
MERQYKDSGIPWMKQIPSDWDIIRGKNLLNLMNRPVREDDDVVTCFRDGEVILRSERRTEGFTMSDKEIGYQGINKGDIVIHGMDGFAGSMGISKSTGKGSPVLIVCNPKSDDDARYIIYYLRSLAMNNVFVALATGIRERSCDLRWNKISVLPFVRPSFGVQKKIADFIDMKSEEIDSLIGLQEQMIEKLKAYKQSVITEAVTKGLNPSAKLVSSGVDWIDEIPEGWEVKPFKELFRTGKGLSFTKADLVKEGVPVISYGQVHSKQNTGTRIDDVLIRFVPDEIAKGGESSKVRVGDFIFADTSEDLSGCGNCVYVDKENGLYAGYHSVIAFSKRKDSNIYLAYLFLTDCWRSQIRCRVSGIKVFSISQAIVKQTSIILPPQEEQLSIASYLDEKCADIDHLIELKQQKIEKLKDYKKSVIYEAVTGKINIES